MKNPSKMKGIGGSLPLMDFDKRSKMNCPFYA